MFVVASFKRGSFFVFKAPQKGVFLFYHFKNPVRENVGVIEKGRSPKRVETPTVRSWVHHKHESIKILYRQRKI